MELTRFRGHFRSYSEGVHYGQTPNVPAGVPALKITDLARAGRSVNSLSEEFTVSRQSIVNWLSKMISILVAAMTA